MSDITVVLKRLCSPVLCVAIFVLTGSELAYADAFSFQGHFTQAADRVSFSVNLPNDSLVLLRTWSYDGGTNASGQAVAAGGFDPMLSLFDENGHLLAWNDDGTYLEVGETLEAYLSISLLSGRYFVVLTQFPNAPLTGNMSDGFVFDDSDLLSGFEGRNGAWALDIVGVHDAAVVPEPSSAYLTFGGALMIALWGLGRQQRNRQPSSSRPSAIQ